LPNPTAAISPQAAAENLPDHAITWEHAARLCRRICVLREQGRATDAQALEEGELARARAALRAVHSETEFDAQFTSLLAAEAERVANAAVLAELLAPRLAELLASNGAATPSSASAISRDSPLPVSPKPRGASANIADFIDEMLAQERPPGSRRAS
jgi:hypothetical protein